MPQTPELAAFVIANALLLVAGGILTALSFRAYSRLQRNALGGAAIGFGLITIGALLELVYEVGIRDGYDMSGTELLVVQTVESLVITAGLAVIFYAISNY